MTKLSQLDLNKEKEILDFLLKNYGTEVFTPGLERTRPLYDELIKTVLTNKTKIITIGGTNGKGQTAYTLNTFFSFKKANTALWTSPHILTIRERFCFCENGEIGNTSYDELFKTIKNCHKICLESFGDIKIYFYEFLFYVFLTIAVSKKKKIDFLILEVGLGGRLDAVNHFDCDCAAIVSISRDHQAILGERYEQILNEKLPIARRKKPLFTQFSLEYLKEKTQEYCLKNHIEWINISSSRDYFLSNQQLAVEIFHCFYPQENSVSLAAIVPTFKGRQEIMTFKGKSIIFIGAHNVDGMRAMISKFRTDKLKLKRTIILSFSKRPLKEIDTMCKMLLSLERGKSKIVLTSFDHPKAMDKLELIKLSKNVNEGLLNFVENWEQVLEDKHTDQILICGSYYFIGEVQTYLLSH